MTITTRDQLIDALANNVSIALIDKASLANTAAGQQFALWRATGVPAQGAIPAAAVLCDHTTLGALPFRQQVAPVTSYIGHGRVVTANALMSVEIVDRLGHMGGLNGTLTTAQAVGLDVTTTGGGVPAARRGAADLSELQWWIEVYTDLGATGVNATANVTYDDASTGNLAVVALGATPRVGRCYPLVSAVPGRTIRGINTITLSATTGAAGNFGVTVTNHKTGMDTSVANRGELFDWAALGLPNVPNGACLAMIVTTSATTTGVIRGGLRIAHG